LQRRNEEVSWLGVVDRGAFPAGSRRQWLSCRDLAAYSCGGSAGVAPDFPVSSQTDASTGFGTAEVVSFQSSVVGRLITED
jgi:hypothetical protein